MVMTKEAVIDAIRKYFGDTTRSAEETRDGLRDIAEEAESLADTINTTEG